MKMPDMNDTSAVSMAADAAPAPKGRGKTTGAGMHVADVKARARKMLKAGSISQKQHDGLIAKADKVSAALGNQNLPDA